MIELARSTGDMREPDLPLTWSAVRIGSGERWTAVAVCANGHAALMDDHEIAEDGTITPSVRCPTEGCDWDAMVRLIGWPPK